MVLGNQTSGAQGWREVGAPRLYTIIRSWIRPFVAVCARTGREAPPPGCTARDIRTARPAGAAHAAPPPAGRRTRRPFPCRLPCGTVTQSFAKFGHLAAAQHVGTTHRNAQLIQDSCDREASTKRTAHNATQRNPGLLISHRAGGLARHHAVLHQYRIKLQGEHDLRLVRHASRSTIMSDCESSIHVTTHAVAERHSHAALSNCDVKLA